MIQKRLHDINTFQCTTDNEVYLVGSDENGAEFTIVFDAIEMLEWVDKNYIKEQTIKYINKL